MAFTLFPLIALQNTMTSLPVYHFPETDITVEHVRRQLLFFPHISYLTPIEIEESQPNDLCTAYTPAPLGDDLGRFQQLLVELKGNAAAFYQGQLSNMDLDYMETRAPETVRDIIDNLHNPGSVSADTNKKSKNHEEIWQARLFLKLAEILRQEHNELAESFTLMQDNQAELLKELKGEEELQDLYNAVGEAQNLQFPVRVESLIKAWGQLLLTGERQPCFLNCFSPEAAEPFFEVNENITGNRPVRLLRLPLPDCDQDPEHFIDKRQIWIDQLADCLPKTMDILHDIASQGMSPTSLSDLAQMAALWSKSYEQKNPWPQSPVSISLKKSCAIPHLEIYLLHKPISELVAKLCAEEKTAPDSTGQWSHGLIAVLSSRSSTCKG